VTPASKYAIGITFLLGAVLGAAGLRFASVVLPRRYGGVRGGQPALVRQPNARLMPADNTAAAAGMTNLAPLATVTASSSADANAGDAGVADGTVDEREWIADAAAKDDWIKLSWERPVTIAEVELYDRRNLAENVLRGVLTFENGFVLPVPALPPDGSPWRVRFLPQTVEWLLFRIESAQGIHPGLAEIKVYGSVSR